MKTQKTNPQLKKLIYSLRKQEANLWQKTARELSRASRKRRDINISKVERFAENGETILIFGKVLGSGDLTKKVTVAALAFGLLRLIFFFLLIWFRI